MSETKHQRLICLKEEARLAREKEEEEEQDDEIEIDPQDKGYEDPTGTGGHDDDNPIKHTSYCFPFEIQWVIKQEEME